MMSNYCKKELLTRQHSNFFMTRTNFFLYSKKSYSFINITLNRNISDTQFLKKILKYTLFISKNPYFWFINDVWLQTTYITYSLNLKNTVLFIVMTEYVDYIVWYIFTLSACTNTYINTFLKKETNI